MSTRRRIKNIDYDDDDYYDYRDEDDFTSEEGSGDEYNPRVAPVIEKKKKVPIILAPPKPPPVAPSVWQGNKRVQTDGFKNICSKSPINLVVIGHVDAGKSTLVGHLLVQLNVVNKSEVKHYQKQSKEAGKASFAFAWILDEGDDERERGVTIDVCVKHFETPSKIFTFLDAPGHQDFVPNMIFGAMQAEVALLVVDAVDFDSGFGPRGRIKEHAKLVRALGIEHMLIAVNKMDAVDWNSERFNDIVNRMTAFLCAPDPLRWKQENIAFVPISAYQGVNLTLDEKNFPLPPALSSWWVGGTLFANLDRLPVPTELLRTEEKPLSLKAKDPFRAIVVDMFVSGQYPQLSLKVLSGLVEEQDTVLILPTQKEGVVKHLEVRNAWTDIAAAGDYITQMKLSTETPHVYVGCVLVGNGKCPKVNNQILVQLLVFDLSLPICQGQQLTCYVHALKLQATVLKVERALNRRTGAPLNVVPKALKVGDIAVVRLAFKSRIVFDHKTEAGPNPLTRVLLRERGTTLAAGHIVAE